MWQLELLDEVIEEIRNIARFYSDTDGQPLVDRFLDQIDEAFQKIRERPHSLRFKRKSVRYVRLKTFPYLVFFQMNEVNSVATIFTVLHEKRHPDAWKKRL